MNERKDYLRILMEILIKSPQLPSALRRSVSVLNEERNREMQEDEEGKDVSLAVKVPKFMIDEEE